jgi:SlyX protein
MGTHMTTTDHSTRISQLEIMFSEQEYTIESLNLVITRQDRDIGLMQQQIELLKQQIKDLKKMVPESDSPLNEKPPHY